MGEPPVYGTPRTLKCCANRQQPNPGPDASASFPQAPLPPPSHNSQAPYFSKRTSFA